jgi:hypothetical protein
MVRTAINESIENGVLKDYLVEAGDEVMSFLTAEYDYDMDIQVNREEAFEDGVQQGLEQGEDRKAVTDILNLMDSLKCDEERAMELLKIPKDKWQEYKTRLLH